MTCRELTSSIADALSGELAEGGRQQFEQHQHACSICSRYVAGYRTAIRLAKAAFEDRGATPSAEVPEAVVAAILHARRTL